MSTAADRYGRAACAYLRVLDPPLAPAARRIVALAGADERARLLDLATGTGAVARAAHARGASVVGVDIAPGMITVAHAASPPAIHFRVADASRLPFKDESFDVVTCGFALSHMTDRAAVLSQVRRVLRRGGRFVASAWGTHGSNSASAAIRAELHSRSSATPALSGPPLPPEPDGAGRAGIVSSSSPPGSSSRFAGILDERTWADAERGSRLLAGAGFSIKVVSEPLRGCFADARAALEWTLAWPEASAAAAALPAAEREQFVRAALAGAAATDLTWTYPVNYFVAERDH